MIKVINIHHKKEEKGEYIGRPSVLGNPYSHLEKTKAKFKTKSREEAIDKYKEWITEQIETNQSVRDELNRLYLIAKRGELVLKCFCSPLPCHGDVIKSLIEEKIKNNQSETK